MCEALGSILVLKTKQQQKMKLDAQACACNPATWEVEIGRIMV
jgi:hypothetical protein